MVILRSISSGKQSAALLPLATRPCVFTAFEMNSTASINDVLPLEAWPTTATVRIFVDVNWHVENLRQKLVSLSNSAPLAGGVRLPEIEPDAPVNQAKSPSAGGRPSWTLRRFGLECADMSALWVAGASERQFARVRRLQDRVSSTWFSHGFQA
jgi:hypothetical protein